MSSVVLSGDSSGSVTLTVPSAAGSNTATVPAQTGTLEMLGQGTAVNASGTSIDFTGIPSWVKRITVMFSGVSSSGSSNYQIQIGSGSVTTSGYLSAASASTANSTSTTGLLACINLTASTNQTGIATLTLLGSNLWVQSSICGANAGGNSQSLCNGSITLSGTLDRIRITTVNGTDTFDAGSINILYEG